ncbi:hypothetical protein cgp_4022 [Corynebacterium glutamicum MB001]|nr:hypothetical protein cgp_4022 [Corynebacterium glutamicum MB001]ASW15346.1 hypothetical protein cgc1_4022 [Corynebacterium glutamicum]
MFLGREGRGTLRQGSSLRANPLLNLLREVLLELLLNLSAPLCRLEVLCNVGEVLNLIEHVELLLSG